MRHDINNIDLPKDSRNNHLEVISKNYFRPLFDPERFVVKEETIDNGVDFRFEIKSNYKVTGFGFNFQLKSTESITKNVDGSYSKNLETSNIEYLLNNGQPAFYGFYIDAEKTFYFISLKKVIRELNTKNPNWQDQANHTVRFTEKLNAESISDIYSIAITEGQMFRRIQGTLAENIGQVHSTEKIIIDTDYQVTADSDTISFIENYGVLLIDQCRWKDVIAMHRKGTAEKRVSVKYNLVVGVSFYYVGEYFKALDFLKEAYKNIIHLDPSLKDYLLFFYYGIQRIMNMISEEEFDQVTKSFEENTHMFLHRKLEEAISLMGKMYDAKEHICLEFEEKINEIINNENAYPYIVLSAKIQLNYYKSERLICRLISLIADGKMEIIQNEFDQIHIQYHFLMKESENIKSTFLHNLVSIKYSRFIVHYDSVIRRQLNSHFLDAVMPEILKSIEHTFLYYASIHHLENELFALTVLLEYYQDLENYEKIAEINTVFDRYKFEYAYLDFNKKIDFTKKDGTFVSQIIRIKNDIDANQREMEILEQEMIAIDKLEQESGKTDGVDKNIINIFPMGFFLVPRDKSDVLFEIFEISDDKLKKQILNMFENFIPVINCYVEKITKEGPLRGQLEFRGLESYRKMHKIRMALHKQGFVRTDLKFR